MKPLACAVATLLLAACALAAYYPNTHMPLRTWTSIEVRHWLVDCELDELVPLFHNRSISGAILAGMDEKTLMKGLNISDAWLAQRLKTNLKLLNKQIAADMKAAQNIKRGLYTTPDGTQTYFHTCQANSDECVEPSSWLLLASYALLPRITILFAGLRGHSLFNLPLRYIWLWLVAPHSAVLHSGLEAYGMPANFTIVIMHLINIAASYYMGYLEIAVICTWVLPNFREAGVELIIRVITQFMCVALFCIDYYNGWYASGMLWLLIGRDLALTLQKALLYWRAYRIVTSQSESH